jgi:hypothetical protein
MQVRSGQLPRSSLARRNDATQEAVTPPTWKLVIRRTQITLSVLFVSTGSAVASTFVLPFPWGFVDIGATAAFDVLVLIQARLAPPDSSNAPTHGPVSKAGRGSNYGQRSPDRRRRNV